MWTFWFLALPPWPLLDFCQAQLQLSAQLKAELALVPIDPATHPQEKLKRALEISQTISIQFLLSRQCLDSVWTVSRHSLDSVWAVYRQCPDSVSTVSERCSIHPQENLKQAWEKSQTISRQCLDCVWTVSGQCLEAVWKVFETEALAHTFFAKLSPSGLRRTLLPSSAPVPAKPSSSFAGLR